MKSRRFPPVSPERRRPGTLAQTVLRLRYAGNGSQPSYVQVAQRLGLSVCEVRRLERAALRGLRHASPAPVLWDEA